LKSSYYPIEVVGGVVANDIRATNSNSNPSSNQTSKLLAKNVDIDISSQCTWDCSAVSNRIVYSAIDPENDVKEDNESDQSTSSSSSPAVVATASLFANFYGPMSGVGTLSFQTLPSICYREDELVTTTSSSSSSLLLELMSRNEEQGRLALSQALKQSILSHKNGQLPPPKKRGIGAEILALTQSLIKASSSSGTTTIPALAEEEEQQKQQQQLQLIATHASSLETESLIALALTIIDTMQRSSAKQFQVLNHWKVAVDVRQLREQEILKLYNSYEDINVCIELGILPHFTTIQHSAETHPQKQQQQQQKLSPNNHANSSGDTNSDNPVDLVHILSILLGLMGLCRYQEQQSGISEDMMDILSSHIANFLLVHCW
jgi:hypothetical protein